MDSSTATGRLPDPKHPIQEDETPRSVDDRFQQPVQAKLLAVPHFSNLWTQLVVDIVDKRAWKVNSFDSLTSLDAYSEDVRHYPVEDERIRMRQRRCAALRLRSKPERWSRLVLDALCELATDSPGSSVATLAQSGLLAVFTDFATHIHYFQVTRSMMESAGVPVYVTANASSSTHDIDKLDPIMLVGYSERWEDKRDTALWNACLESHYSLSPHHQQHKLWHAEESDHKEQDCWKALSELVCDKASRKLQKQLRGTVSPDMWTMDTQFYVGMPEVWLKRAIKMTEDLAARTPP